MSSSAKVVGAAAIAVAAAAVWWASSDGEQGGARTGERREVAAAASPDAAEAPARNAAPVGVDRTGEQFVAPATAAVPELAAASLHVRVSDWRGDALSGATIVLFRGDVVLGRAVSEGGLARLPAPLAAPAELIVDHWNAAPWRTTVAADLRDFDAKLPRGALLSGTVIAPDRRAGERLDLQFRTKEPYAAFRDLPRSVMEAVTANPNPRVHVHAPVEADGSFCVAGLDPGSWGELLAPHEYSFEPVTRKADGQHSRVGEQPVERPEEGLTLRLFTLPALTARVVHPDGAPVQRFRVTLSIRGPVGTLHDFKQVYDGNGWLRLPLRGPRTASLALDVASEEDAGVAHVDVDPPFDEARDLGEIVLSAQRTVRLLACDLRGAPISGAHVLTFEGGAIGSAFRLDETGGGFFLSSDIREVRVAALGYETRSVALPDGDVDEPIVVTLEEAAELTVRIETEAGELVSDMIVELRSKRPLLRDEPARALVFNDLIGGAARANVVGNAAAGWIITLWPDAEEGARLGDLVPGVEIALLVRDSQYAYHYSEKLSLAPHESRKVVVRIPAAPRSLRGRIVDEEGQPIASAFVTVDTDATTIGKSSASSASDGSFEISGLFRDRFVLRASCSGFASLELPRFELPEVDAVARLVLKRAWSLAVLVVDAAGARVNDVSVSARPRDTGAGVPRRWDARFRSEGMHLFGDLAFEPVVVTVLHAGAAIERVVEPPTAEMRVEVPLTGRVVVHYDLLISEDTRRAKTLDSIELVPTGAAGVAVVANALRVNPPRRDGCVEFPAVLPGGYALFLRWGFVDGVYMAADLERVATSTTITVGAGVTVETRITR